MGPSESDEHVASTLTVYPLRETAKHAVGGNHETDWTVQFTSPSSSVMVKLTGYSPGEAYTWVAVTPLPAGVPSPQSQEYETMFASTSVVQAASTSTTRRFVDATKHATGANRGRTVWDVLPWRPWSSVTVRTIVFEPAVIYVWTAVTPLPAGVPSPQSQEYTTIVPSGSEEAGAATLTDSRGIEAVKLAVGRRKLIDCGAESVNPSASVTVRVIE